ncbi:guanine nucleotide-binding protein subunit alpha [Ilyonectria sp. MPI-CAGE-AT-0026]|nr:guanine nucleotide-binding protein subunit alpha [Ilyonectria sp. MPI-CAGE-AT-0026]
MSIKEKEGKARNNKVKNLLKWYEMQRNPVKLLLLGAGKSGKSTIMKQMKLIYKGGYSRDERESFKEIIFSNTVQSMRVILEDMESLKLSLEDQRIEHHVQTIFIQPAQIKGEVLPPEVGSAIEGLWKDRGVQHYLDNIARIAAPDYTPNEQDVLRSRVKTTGITETTFIIGDVAYRMFDISHQRCERRKWIHCFDDVAAILFLVDLSDYDQPLPGDETVNRMQEAMTLFGSICNSRLFFKTPIILFLNKIDRFKEKLPDSPMKDCFPDYEGGDDCSAACRYIVKRFVSLKQHEPKRVYAHFTCATDTTQIRIVMEAVNGILLILRRLLLIRLHRNRHPPMPLLRWY